MFSSHLLAGWVIPSECITSIIDRIPPERQPRVGICPRPEKCPLQLLDRNRLDQGAERVQEKLMSRPGNQLKLGGNNSTIPVNTGLTSKGGCEIGVGSGA